MSAVDKFIDFVGKLCATVLILLVLLVFYNVIMRYFFNTTSIGMQELEWHLFSISFMFGLGYTIKHNAHVRIDIFYSKFSEKTQVIIDLIGALLFTTPITILIIVYGIEFSLDSYNLAESSPDPGGLPYRWLVKSIIPLAFLYLLLCNFFVVAVKARRLKKLLIVNG